MMVKKSNEMFNDVLLKDENYTYGILNKVKFIETNENKIEIISYSILPQECIKNTKEVEIILEGCESNIIYKVEDGNVYILDASPETVATFRYVFKMR